MPGRRQHGEGSVYQRKRDGRWVAVEDLGWRNGKRDRREFTSAVLADALAKRQRFRDRRSDGFTMPKGRQPYVSEWMLHWLHNVAKRKVEETTWHNSYRQKVTELICPYFERTFLHELCEEDIEDWHRELESVTSARTGRPLSPSTIGQCHRIMSTALKLAVVRGKLPRNPCSNVTPPRAARPVPEPPSADEVKRILARCETWENGCRWIVALKTGLRQGEALALRWSDIDLAAGTVSIRHSAARVQRERIVKEPKSAKSRRTIPLPASAASALRAHKESQSVASLGGLVFVSPRGAPVHPRADYGDWHALLDDLKIRLYRVHDCRHAVATMLLEEGTDPRVVQDIMGWSTVAMTEIYQHVRPALMARAMDVLDGRA
jgi:integrase